MKEKVLEILGVEINEEFFLQNPVTFTYDTCKYRINDSLYVEVKQNNNSWGKSIAVDLNDILLGKHIICKMHNSFKPEEEESYYTLVLNGPYGNIGISSFRKNDDKDLLKYALGLTFKTEKEAIDMFNVVVSKAKKAYDTGIPLVNWSKI